MKSFTKKMILVASVVAAGAMPALADFTLTDKNNANGALAGLRARSS